MTVEANRRVSIVRYLILAAATLAAAARAQTENIVESRANASRWPGFRGYGDSRTDAKSLPLKWSETENVAWKHDLRGYGQSSPVVWDGLVFVTSTEGEQKERLIVTCLDLESGSVRWVRELGSSHPAEANDMSSRGAPTPGVDGERLYVLFESGDLMALDHQGNPIWARDLVKDNGAFAGSHGVGSSPLWTPSGLVVLIDHAGPSYLMSLDLRTGEERWRHDRAPRMSWSSPIAWREGERCRILVSSNGVLEGCESSDGKLIFRFEDVQKNTVPSPTPDGRSIVIGSSDKDSNLELSVPESGPPAVRWRAPEAGAAGFGSPLIDGDRVYFSGPSGTLACVDRGTGSVLWRERIPESCWASPIAGCGRIYLFCIEGSTVVLDRAGDAPKVLAENRIPTEDRVYGVAPVEGCFVVRTGSRVYCLRAAEKG